MNLFNCGASFFFFTFPFGFIPSIYLAFRKKKKGLTEIMNYIFYIEGFERKKLNRIHVKL